MMHGLRGSYRPLLHTDNTPKAAKMNAIHALAESWASMDGKLDQFSKEAAGEITDEHPAYTGAYLQSLAEAEELIYQLGKRGFKIVPMD